MSASRCAPATIDDVDESDRMLICKFFMSLGRPEDFPNLLFMFNANWVRNKCIDLGIEPPGWFVAKYVL